VGGERARDVPLHLDIGRLPLRLLLCVVCGRIRNPAGMGIGGALPT
jgi:hypothetical protein